jgi:hypothetical protein
VAGNPSNTEYLLNAIAEDEADGAQLAAWQWLADRQLRYPTGGYMPPFGPTKRVETARPITVFSFLAEPTAENPGWRATHLAIDDGRAPGIVELPSGEQGAENFVRAVCTHRARSTLVVCLNGARFGFHLLLRQIGSDLVAKGWAIRPVVAGTSLRMVKLSKDRHTWTLADYEEVTGDEETPDMGPDGPWYRNRDHSLPHLASCLSRLVQLGTIAHEYWGVSLRPTLGGTALAAARSTLPKGFVKWRPSPLSVALCRAGGGYRGGYVFGERYRGPLYKIDLTQAYAWSLSEPLPLASALAPYDAAKMGGAGLWVARVRGGGNYRAYLSTWDYREGRFRLGTFAGGHAVAVVSSAEIDGLRALGFDVAPGWGFRWTQTFTLAPFVASLSTVRGLYGRASGPGRWAKRIGNALAGKFGSSPLMTELCYSQTAPRGGWTIFTDVRGEEVPDLWTRQQLAWQPYQQVDIAATVTARVRGRVYEAVRWFADNGGRVVACDTDMVAGTINPAPLLTAGPAGPGDWRLIAHDTDGVIVGARAEAIGARARLPGARGVTREMVELVHAGQWVSVGGRTTHLPWTDAALYSAVERRFGKQKAAG